MADGKQQVEASKTETKTDLEVSEKPSISKEWLDKAAQGLEEYQLKVGKEYLTLADSSVNREENGKLAVYWLSQASKQGNDEATKELKECLENETGITDENREDVKWCVSTSDLEKKIRFAAKNMFKTINSTHKEVLSAEEYSDAIKKLTGGTEQKLLLAAGQTLSSVDINLLPDDKILDWSKLKEVADDNFKLMKFVQSEDSDQTVNALADPSLYWMHMLNDLKFQMEMTQVGLCNFDLSGKKIGEQISENEFVKLLSRKVQGTSTLTSSERSDAYEAAGVVEKIFKYPRETAMVVGDSALEFASRDGLGMVLGCIPVDQIYLLMLFFVYGFLSPKILFIVIPLVVFYIAYAAMVITTLQMFYKRKKLKEANALAELLKQYDTAVDVDQTQSQYSWNSLTPYLVYFSSVPIVVMSFALADKLYIPCSEFCVLSAVLCGICFVALSDSHDLITLMALIFNFLAALPVFFHDFPEIPVITPMIHLFSSSFVSIDLVSGIQLNIGIGSICYCLVPLFFVQMAARKSFQGMYRVLVPHLVCYFWFSMITSMYKFSTWFGLARATVGYVLLPILIPLSAFIAIGFIGYVFVKMMSSEMFGKIIVTILLACIPLLLTQTKKLFGGKFDKRFATLKKILMIFFALLAVVPLIFVRLPAMSKKTVVELALPDYIRMCTRGNDPDTADLQVRCNDLKGTRVAWSGVFKHAKVSSVSNDIGKMLDVFPTFVSSHLRCIYGKNQDCDAEGISDSDKEYCELLISLGQKCHIDEHDKYTFNLQVVVKEGEQTLTLSIDAGHGFKETLVALQPDDEVTVKGVLIDGLGTTAPKLKLKEVKCTSRQLPVMQMVEIDSEDMYYDLFEHAFQVAFNFFWHPLLEFVPSSESTAGMEPATEV